MQRKIERRDFSDFWKLYEDKSIHDPRLPMQFSDGMGYHVYAELRLNLDLIAAENSKDAFKCIELLEDFTSISDRCATLADLRVLEIQGDRIHFFLPAITIADDNLLKLLAFSAALTQTVENQLKPAAGDDWKGFSMAADWGVCVFVPSDFGGGSLISLGNPANAPAKKIGAGVASGCLALPQDIGKKIPGAKPSGRWIELDVSSSARQSAAFFDPVLTNRMISEAKQVLDVRHQMFVNRSFNQTWGSVPLSQAPFRTGGMCLRADLDGFTKSVQAAFEAGPDAVSKLVEQFSKILQFPKTFASEIGRPVVELPWAGDCCTLLIQPAFQETVAELRSVLPVVGGKLWHEIARRNESTKNWAALLSTSKWAVGLACGDEQEGGNGKVVVTEFSARNRAFRVMVGWSAKRAKDAQEADGVKGEFVVVPNVDFKNIEELYKPYFEQLTASYRSTTYEKLSTSRQENERQLTKSSGTKISAVATAIPSPRPYART